MGYSPAILILSWANALFILAAVWVLAQGGTPRRGNILGLFAAASGVALNGLLGLWPMTAMNVILLVRFLYCLRIIAPRGRGDGEPY